MHDAEWLPYRGSEDHQGLPAQSAACHPHVGTCLAWRKERRAGTVWHGGRNGERELLQSCYRNSLELAAKHGLQSIAFPCISTGVYRFPADQAAEIAAGSVRQFLETPSSIRTVIFCCFSEADRVKYETLLEVR